MDIESLKNRHNLSVQEQTFLRRDEVFREADYWRKNAEEIPQLLRAFLQSKNMDLTKSIFLDYERNFPGCSSDYGFILSQDQHFYEFEVDIENESIIDSTWKEVTEDLDLSPKRAGSGPTRFYLALEVQEELNRQS